MSDLGISSTEAHDSGIRTTGIQESIDLGLADPLQQGLGKEVVKGATQGFRNIEEGTLATLAELGTPLADERLARIQAEREFSRDTVPAPGIMNDMANKVGGGVEQLTHFAAMAAGAATGVGATVGLATSIFTQSFGSRKRDLMQKGASESEATFGAVMSSGMEVVLEGSLGAERMVGPFMDDFLGGMFRQGGRIAGSNAKAATLKRAMRIPGSFGKRVLGNLAEETIEEELALAGNAVLDKALTGKYNIKGGDVFETAYDTILKSAVPSLIGAGFSGGRADIRRQEKQASIHAPITEETLSRAYTTTATLDSTQEEAQAVAAAQVATMDAHMEAVNQILAKRFTPAEAQANSTLIRTMAENLAAMNPEKTPVDYVADVRMAFEQGQIDQDAWNAANTIEDPSDRLREKDRLMREIPGFGEQYYDTTEQAVANEIRNDNDARELETFQLDNEQTQAAQLKDSVKAPAGQDTFVVPAQSAMSQQQYDKLYKRGTVRGVVIDGQSYKVLARGKVAGPEGGYHIVQPGSVLFQKSNEIAPPQVSEGPADTVEEDLRSNMLDFADSADVEKAWAAGPQTDTQLAYAKTPEEVAAEEAEAVTVAEEAAQTAREGLQAVLELQLEQLEASVDEVGISVTDLEDLAVLNDMQAEDIASVRAKITAAEPTPSTAQIDKFLARKEAAAQLTPPAPAPIPTPVAAPIKSFDRLADEIERREKSRAAGKDPNAWLSQDTTSPRAYYNIQEKAMHFLSNATAEDVVHEWFHHMTETTGLLPTPMRDALVNEFSIDGNWNNQSAELAVNSLLDYFRKKQLPEGSSPQLEKAFDYMRRILAASSQANAGVFNDETLAIFDTMFGFPVTPEESFIGNALNDRLEHAKGFETDEPEARWAGPATAVDEGRLSEAPVGPLTEDQQKALRKRAVGSASRVAGRAEGAAFARTRALELFPDLEVGEEGSVLRQLSDEQLTALSSDLDNAAAYAINSSLEKDAWWMFGRNPDGTPRANYVNFQSLSPEQQAEVRNKTMAGWEQNKSADAIEKNPELTKNKTVLDEFAKQTTGELVDELAEKPTGGAGALPEGGTSGRFGLLADEAKLMSHAAKRFRYGLWNKVMVQTKGPLDLIAVMADGNTKSAFHKIGGMITEAGKRLVLQQRKTQAGIDVLMEKHGLASWPRTLGRPIKLAGKVMKREHAFTMAMYTRNELAQDDTGRFINKQAEALFLSNGRKLVGADEHGFVNRKQFIELAEASWEYVQSDPAALATMKVMDDYFVSAAEEIDATRTLLGEKPIGKVKGYFPMARVGGMMADMDVMGLAMGITPNKSMEKMGTNARQKARTSEFGKDIVMDALRVFEGYVKQADIFVAKEPLVRQAQKSVRGAMVALEEKSLGAEGQMLLDLIETERHANGRSTVMSPQEHLIQVVTGAYKRSLIGANAPVVFRQAISMPTAMALLPVSSAWMMGSSFLKLHGYAISNVRKGSPNVLEGHPVWEMMKAGGSAHTSSEYITTETTGREGASGAQTGITIGGVKLIDIPLLPIRYMDMVTRTAVWGTAYASKKAELMNEKTMTDKEIHEVSFAHADDITRQTQPPANLSDRAQIQKSNEYLKGLVPFTGQLFKNWNIFNRHLRLPASRAWEGGFERDGAIGALQDVMGVIIGTGAAKQAYGATQGAGQVFAFTYVVPAMALSTLARGRPPEDFEEFMSDLFAYNIAMIPVIGPVISAKLLWDKATADASPLYANMLEDMADVVGGIAEGEDVTDQVFRAVSRGTGIPSSFQRIFNEAWEGQFGQLDNLDWDALWKDGVMNFKD